MIDIPTHPIETVAPITGMPITLAQTCWCPFVGLTSMSPAADKMVTTRGVRLRYGDPESQIQQAFKCITTGCMSWIADASAPTTHGTCRLITGAGLKA
jgi:hypothetical protein